MKILNKLEAALLIGLILAILVGATESTRKIRDEISDNVLRLHILANSDSDEDQSLKLKIRDRVLEKCPEIFDGTDISAAASKAKEKLDALLAAAREVIAECGFDYDVRANVTDMYFEAREYDGFTMPAGEYAALRIEIGEAKGKNWWCVMYPPLCLPAAEKTTEDYFTEKQCDMLGSPKKYKLAFRLLELAEELKSLAEEAPPQPAARSFGVVCRKRAVNVLLMRRMLLIKR